MHEYVYMTELIKTSIRKTEREWWNNWQRGKSWLTSQDAQDMLNYPLTLFIEISITSININGFHSNS